MRPARRTMLRACRGVVRQLEIPQPFDVIELCTGVGTRRGRPIELIPMRMEAGGPCGVWVAGGSADYIFYEGDTSPLHRDHIILHELGHILAGHTGVSVSAEEYARLLMPDLDPSLVQTVLGRSSFSGRQEREAELFAQLVWERVRNIERLLRLRGPEANEVLERMRSTFGEVREP